MEDMLAHIDRIMTQGGPDKEHFEILTEAFNTLWEDTRHDEVARDAVRRRLQGLMSEALDETSMQGFALRKPFGYAGDFMIIEKIYDVAVASEGKCRRWDEYFHAQSAPKAVRNRKTYFESVVVGHHARVGRPLHVLSLGSGPCCEIAHFIGTRPDCIEKIICVDLDPNAIAHSKDKLRNSRDRVEIVRQNVFNLKVGGDFDVIWSSGLFDYFSDKIFVRILTRLKKLVRDGGILSIGNFSPNNTTRGYMELVMEWTLIHRSEEILKTIARKVFPKADVFVESEREGLNLFLNILKTETEGQETSYFT